MEMARAGRFLPPVLALSAALGGLTARAQPLRQGTVILSDGDSIEGAVDLGPFRIFATGPGKWFRLDPTRVARIRTEVVAEEIAQAWVFVEEGSRE